ncbi:unnamed protein product [Rotaria sp. Silwood1]|nr:unnamed protein product [Rotaria sp. Silwood1]CAF3609179.1 unnamed protein product [Rotaria sp. Silwood1]CAF3630339.1 unnamed protein product [Rotaria sp. Silwood1]CAF4737542.1 unnamed protein product [Rotaria sp. Silwood1]CAF4784788.1 unnamed protein product [Rotaria sp. Silwood1]
MKTTTHSSISDRLGAIFFVSIHQTFRTGGALEALIKERLLFSHENTSGYYRTSTFFLAKILCDLFPMRFIPSFIFSIIAYPLTGFQRSINRFLIFCLTIFINSIFGSAWFSCLKWTKYISGIRYCSNILTINEFRNLTFCVSNNTHICPMTGEQVLTERNIPHNTNWNMWKNLHFISIMALVFSYYGFYSTVTNENN